MKIALRILTVTVFMISQFSFSHTNIQTSHYIDLPTSFTGGPGARNINSKALQRSIQSINHDNSDLINAVFGENTIETVLSFYNELYIASQSKDYSLEISKLKKNKKTPSRSVAFAKNDISCETAMHVGIVHIQAYEVASLITNKALIKFPDLHRIPTIRETDEYLKFLNDEVMTRVNKNEINDLVGALIISSSSDKGFKQSVELVLREMNNTDLNAINRMSTKEKSDLFAALRSCQKRG
jgi:hypothetical protein